MSDAKSDILAGIRRSLKRGPLGEGKVGELMERLERHPRNLVPARAVGLGQEALIQLFISMAEEAQATVTRLAHATDVPEAVADYLAQHNLPSRLVMTPDPRLDEIPWAALPMLEIRRGRAEDSDLVGVSACFAAIAETGTLMLLSGPESPTSNNFLPDTHLVVLRRAQVVGAYEEAWTRLRAARGSALPRTVNFITGPSRTADIEQRLELGAHGPRRLHIVLIDETARPDGDGGTPA